MATKPNAPKQATTTAAAATAVQAPQAASPLPTVAVATTQQVPAVAVLVPSTYAGLPFAQLTKTQQGFATAKHAPSLGTLAPVALVLGNKAYRVRSGNNAAWWQACTTALAAGPAPASAMVAAGACPKFVQYAVARGWLAKAPA